MPFGLRNAAQSFQRNIHKVCRGLHFILAYIDDAQVASAFKAEHEQHLFLLFERLMYHGVVTNASKCVVGASELEFNMHQGFINSLRFFLYIVKILRKYVSNIVS